MPSLTITPLAPDIAFGNRVDGVTWDNIDDEELRAQLRALFVERGVLVFENMEPTPKMQLALSRVFGQLKDHPTRNVPRADGDMLGVIDMHVMPRGDPGHDHGLIETRGKKVSSFLPWHFDHSYNDELNYAGVLRAVIAAPEEGRTGFADGIDIYKKMNPAILAKIEKLCAIYTLDVRLTQMKFGRYFETYGDTERERANTEESTVFPRSLHPMVWQRPSGEKVVHFCGFTNVGIEHHENAEGEALLEQALQEMYRAITPYWHEWNTTDLLIWDNHRVLHAVEGCDPKYERRMHRTTIKGDYGLGRFEGGKKIGEVKREVAPLALPG